MIFPTSESHFHGVATKHKEQTGLPNFAVLSPSISCDGESLLCGVVTRERTRTTHVVIYQLKEKTFYEITFDEAIDLYNFETSLPVLDFVEIEQLYNKHYFIETKSTTARSNKSKSSYHDLHYEYESQDNLDNLLKQKKRGKQQSAESTLVKDLKLQLTESKRAVESLQSKSDKGEKKRANLDTLLKQSNDSNKKMKIELNSKQKDIDKLEAKVNNVSQFITPIVSHSKSTSSNSSFITEANNISLVSQIGELKIRNAVQETQLQERRNQQTREDTIQKDFQARENSRLEIQRAEHNAEQQRQFEERKADKDRQSSDLKGMFKCLGKFAPK